MSFQNICRRALFWLAEQYLPSRWVVLIGTCLVFGLTNGLWAAEIANPPLSEIIESAPRAPDFGPWNDLVLDKLGYTLSQTFAELGVPTEVFAMRGEQAWQDDVVFYYDSDHFYLFWWDNRVWQIRFDQRYVGQVIGVNMGQSRTEVKSLLGGGMRETAEDLYYQLPDRGFPVRARLVFSNDRLSDIYLYRADF